jgi:hypothetical protein
MSRTLHLSDGHTFVEPDNWVEYLRNVVTERELLPTFGINLKYDYAGVDRLIGELYDRLQGTGADVAMADAALRLLETGSPDEMYAARIAPFAAAPNAYDRLLKLVTDHRDRLVQARMLTSVLSELIRLRPDDPRGIGALTAEATRTADPYVFDLVAAHAADWLVDHLPPLSSQMDPLHWIGRAPENHKRALVEALVAKGPEYVARTIEPIVNNPNVTSQGRAELAARVNWHPVFARALAGEHSPRA